MITNTLVGKKLKAYIETAGGEVLTGQCVAVQMSVDFIGRYSARQEWSIDLQGIGDLILSSGSELAPGIAKRLLPKEWLCEYCGRANYINEQQCGSCGWYRGIIADVVQEAGVWRTGRSQ